MEMVDLARKVGGKDHGLKFVLVPVILIILIVQSRNARDLDAMATK
jgi:hypothetical protein